MNLSHKLHISPSLTARTTTSFSNPRVALLGPRIGVTMNVSEKKIQVLMFDYLNTDFEK